MTSPAKHDSAVQAVVFDLDDTLYLERDYVHSGYRAVAARLRQTTGRAEDFAEWMWARFCRGEAANMFNALDAHFGLGLGADGVGELVGCYRDHRPEVAPTAEAAALLGQLHGQVKLGILSDGFLPAQQYKFDALGVAELFDAVVFTESLGRECWKPARAGFEHVAAQLETPHVACAYIGDNPSKDFVAPNALGWRTIQWRQAGQVHADKPTAAGGAAQHFVHTGAEVLAALGLAEA